MPRPGILVTDALPREAKDALSVFDLYEPTSDEAAVKRCRGLLCWPARTKSELFRRMENLEAVQTFSAGVDGLDFRSLRRGVQVFSTAGAYAESVGEHAWGVLLGVAKGVHLRNRKAAPRTLRGKTLVVLGAGAIGSEVARLSRSLGMRTVGVSRSFRAPELFEEKRPLSELRDVIGSADAVVVSLPSTNGTQGALTYDILSRAKETVVVVNVGRGEIVDEGGLMRWLKERPESRYATDVFWAKGGKEDFDTPAWELPNFAGTLHDAGLPFGEDLSKAKAAAARNIRRHFETGDALNRVDPSEYL